MLSQFGLRIAIACPHASATPRLQDTADLTATVTDVDLANRLVILELPDGSFLVGSVVLSIHRPGDIDLVIFDCDRVLVDSEPITNPVLEQATWRRLLVSNYSSRPARNPS